MRRNYDAATNAYQRRSPCRIASVAARSQAQCGLGIIQEKLAETGSTEERKAMLLRARISTWMSRSRKTSGKARRRMNSG